MLIFPQYSYKSAEYICWSVKAFFTKVYSLCLGEFSLILGWRILIVPHEATNESILLVKPKAYQEKRHTVKLAVDTCN